MTVYQWFFWKNVLKICVFRWVLKPIHKKGSKCEVSNYWSVSLASPVAKVLDSIIADIISFNARKIIAEEQHGFIKSRSTMTNLFVFADYVLNSLESGFHIKRLGTVEIILPRYW